MSVVHAHRVKRKNTKRNTKLVLFFDKLVVFMGILNLVATLPQVITIWAGKDAAGVSSISWGYYSIFSVTFFIYGLIHKEKPIIITYSGSALLYMLIFVGSLIY